MLCYAMLCYARSVLLQTMDHVRRGVVDWSRVNTQANDGIA